MERNREEKIAIFIALFWFMGNLALYFIDDYKMVLFNYGCMTLIAGLILLKERNNNFKKWLKK